MIPDGQKVWTEGRNGRTDGRTQPKLYPSDFVGNKKFGSHNMTVSHGISESMLCQVP